MSNPSAGRPERAPADPIRHRRHRWRRLKRKAAKRLAWPFLFVLLAALIWLVLKVVLVH